MHLPRVRRAPALDPGAPRRPLGRRRRHRHGQPHPPVRAAPPLRPPARHHRHRHRRHRHLARRPHPQRLASRPPRAGGRVALPGPHRRAPHPEESRGRAGAVARSMSRDATRGAPGEDRRRGPPAITRAPRSITDGGDQRMASHPDRVQRVLPALARPSRVRLTPARHGPATTARSGPAHPAAPGAATFRRGGAAPLRRGGGTRARRRATARPRTGSRPRRSHAGRARTSRAAAPSSRP